MNCGLHRIPASHELTFAFQRATRRAAHGSECQVSNWIDDLGLPRDTRSRSVAATIDARCASRRPDLNHVHLVARQGPGLVRTEVRRRAETFDRLQASDRN